MRRSWVFVFALDRTPLEMFEQFMNNRGVLPEIAEALLRLFHATGTEPSSLIWLIKLIN